MQRLARPSRPARSGATALADNVCGVAATTHGSAPPGRKERQTAPSSWGTTAAQLPLPHSQPAPVAAQHSSTHTVSSQEPGSRPGANRPRRSQHLGDFASGSARLPYALPCALLSRLLFLASAEDGRLLRLEGTQALRAACFGSSHCHLQPAPCQNEHCTFRLSHAVLGALMTCT